MNKRRWKLYNVFMLVPIGMLKALATKTSDLDERDAPNENGNGEEGKGTMQVGRAASPDLPCRHTLLLCSSPPAVPLCTMQGGMPSSFKLDIAKKQERTVSPSFWTSLVMTVRGMLGLPTNKIAPSST